MPATASVPSAVVPGQEGGQLTTAMLAAADPEQQKQMLGERLFPLVSRLQPELAGKITGQFFCLLCKRQCSSVAISNPTQCSLHIDVCGSQLVALLACLMAD